MERIVEILVDASGDGVRLDVYCSERFTYHSRNEWQNEIRSGSLTLNGLRTRPSRRLRTGDRLTYSPIVDEPPVDFSWKVAYEDDHILVVDKPPNLPCHPAGAYFNNTLWASLRGNRGDGEELFFVTRLDRETSGLTLIAKSNDTAAKFAETAPERLIECKKYLVWVFGDFPDELIAEGYLSERGEGTPEGMVRKKRFFTSGKPKGVASEAARTLFAKLADGAAPKSGEPLSLVEAELDTGRTHQIRATLASLGFPVVGDKLYGPDETIFIRFIEGRMTDADRDLLLLPFQALHACSLVLRHPASGSEMEFAAPPPDEWSVLGAGLKCGGSFSAKFWSVYSQPGLG